jgi:subtilisin family serine protease
VGDDHGTHVAGIIAAQANNGLGILGMCGNQGGVRVIPAKFIGPTGGTTAAAVAKSC